MVKDRANNNGSARQRGGKPILLLIVLLTGLALAFWQPLSLAELLALGREVSASPWLLATVVLAMALLFTFGLPGSLAMWLIAPFQPPLLATLLLVAGSVAGAFGAYLFSRRLRGNWQPEGLAGRVFELLERRGDWFTQTALRVLPGFPHSVVNFAGGLLLLPLLAFLLSALVGLTIKWGVYVFAVSGMVEAVESGEAIQASTLLPLFILSVLLIGGTVARSRMARS